jgi:hypothetical protein
MKSPEPSNTPDAVPKIGEFVSNFAFPDAAQGVPTTSLKVVLLFAPSKWSSDTTLLKYGSAATLNYSAVAVSAPMAKLGVMPLETASDDGEVSAPESSRWPVPLDAVPIEK